MHKSLRTSKAWREAQLERRTQNLIEAAEEDKKSIEKEENVSFFRYGYNLGPEELVKGYTLSGLRERL